MRRLQLFEWEDQAWLPQVLRDFITDHLKYSSNEPMREPVNRAMAELLAGLLRETNSTQIVDLCSGAGGPWPSVSKLLAQKRESPVAVVLTDLYPNVDALSALERESGGRIQVRRESTSAFDVPEELCGVRTVFTAIHHFPPDQVRRVLEDAVEKNVPIAIFEPLERSLRFVVLIGVTAFVRGFTHTPRVGRLGWKRLLFTYLLPVAPLVFAWDGVVSVLRSYDAADLRAIATGLDARYRWTAGRFAVDGPFGEMPTTFLTGVPVEEIGHKAEGPATGAGPS
jgi:hypothetical protein